MVCGYSSAVAGEGRQKLFQPVRTVGSTWRDHQVTVGASVAVIGYGLFVWLVIESVKVSGWKSVLCIPGARLGMDGDESLMHCWCA